MVVKVNQRIVVPNRPAVDNGLAVAPFYGVHLHSTANTRATIQEEIDFLSRNWPNGYYTHIVGFNQETGKPEAWQVAQKNAGAYDVGGSANWEQYASIEFSENIPNQKAFDVTYKLYVDLARQLVMEIQGADYKLNDGSYTGLETHRYISATGRGSDHTDPDAFLKKWGISQEQFAKDLLNGVKDTSRPAYKEPKAGDIITTTRVGQLQNSTGTGKLFPADKVDMLTINKGAKVTFKRKVGNAYEVEFYKMGQGTRQLLYLHNSQFK